MRFSELRENMVINLKNGRNLGRVCDVCFDARSGRLQSIVVPEPNRICCLFGSDSEYVIPFDCIVRIGPDAVLVDICEEKFLSPCGRGGRRTGG